MSEHQANGTSNHGVSARVELNIPPSSTSVTVKIIDVASVNNVPSHALFTPPVKGIDAHCAPSFCFLIEHPSGKKVLFDLAIRKDWENLAPAITERFKKVGHQPVAEKNVSELLDESGIGKESIDAVIWRQVTLVQDQLTPIRRFETESHVFEEDPAHVLKRRLPRL